MATRSPHPFSRAFTLIELLIVIVTVSILAALAIPAFNGVFERAKAAKDLSNLRQVGMLMQTYLNDKDQILPATGTWPGTTATNVLYPKYTGTRRVFQSPFDKRTPSETDTAPVSYGINTNMYALVGGNMLKVVSPASTFFMAPNYPTAPGKPTNIACWPGNATNAPDLPLGGLGETTGTHSNGNKINVLFCDFHTESVTFGPATTEGTFQDKTLPLGQKHWDPTK